MTEPYDLDKMSLEDLVELSERAQKKIAERIAAENSELEKRMAALAKLSDRVSGKKTPKAPSRPRRETTKGKGAAADAANSGNPENQSSPQPPNGDHPVV